MENTVMKQLATLQRMDLEALRGRWRALYGTEPPVAYNKAQLVRRLAWRIQELHYGGLSDGARQRLREIADADNLAGGKRRQRKRKAGTLAPGTRLVRHFRDVEHIVTATSDGGFEYQGRRHRTLTAVAKIISGQHVSGPRFFGLVGPGKENA